MVAEYEGTPQGFYQPMHYDIDLVYEMLRQTIAESRSTQQFVLLKGSCGTHRLAEENDRLARRYMDEIFAIEKHIGEVAAVISM